jgi:hypothetical protein
MSSATSRFGAHGAHEMTNMINMLTPDSTALHCVLQNSSTEAQMRKLVLAAIIALGLGTAFVAASLHVQAQSAPAQGQ